MTHGTWIFRTMIIPASLAGVVRSMTDNFGQSAALMFRTPLSPTGALPATHYISTGLIGEMFAEMMDSPEALVTGASGLGISVSLQDATAILSAADVSNEEPFIALARLGLKLIQEGA